MACSHFTDCAVKAIRLASRREFVLFVVMLLAHFKPPFFVLIRFLQYISAASSRAR